MHHNTCLEIQNETVSCANLLSVQFYEKNVKEIILYDLLKLKFVLYLFVF